ncbi:TPA: hypothetical protein ACN33X_001385 [Vibrio parahaemolyticus]
MNLEVRLEQINLLRKAALNNPEFVEAALDHQQEIVRTEVSVDAESRKKGTQQVLRPFAQIYSTWKSSTAD